MTLQDICAGKCEGEVELATRGFLENYEREKLLEICEGDCAQFTKSRINEISFVIRKSTFEKFFGTFDGILPFSALKDSMFVFEASDELDELDELCQKRKKAYGYYVKVFFMGLHSLESEKRRWVLVALCKMLRRFKAHSIVFVSDSQARGAGAQKRR
ncbi:MAG: hypothetical protein ACTTH5_00115 [Wolinella sp.]